MENIEIGDTIRDVEDGDCYVEGVVVSLNPLKYVIEREQWGGIDYFEDKGTITDQQWWYIEVIKKG